MSGQTLLDYLRSPEWDGLLNAALLEEICRKQSYHTWNWEMPTMGGDVFWDTLPVDGWKIQRHIALPHCRVLDPNNTRRAYGNEDEIKGEFVKWLSNHQKCSKGRYGLVFAGGGGKGAFEVGVWKYLRERGLDTLIDGVSGTSVGALNGLLFVNGSYELAEEIWSQITYKDMMPPDAVVENILRKLSPGVISKVFCQIVVLG